MGPEIWYQSMRLKSPVIPNGQWGVNLVRQLRRKNMLTDGYHLSVVCHLKARADINFAIA